MLDEHSIDSIVVSGDSPEQHTLLRELLMRLPAELAVYRYLDGMTHDEIAEVFGCSRRHVGDLIGRLHGLVEDEEEPS